MLPCRLGGKRGGGLGAMAMGAVLGTALGTDMMTIKGLARRSIAAGFTLDVVRDEVLSRVLDEKEVWGL